MKNTHSFGRFYVVVSAGQGAGSPLIDRCLTYEREGEMRVGDGVLIRAPFTGDRATRGVVIGRWRKPPDGSGGGMAVAA